MATVDVAAASRKAMTWQLGGVLSGANGGSGLRRGAIYFPREKNPRSDMLLPVTYFGIF